MTYGHSNFRPVRILTAGLVAAAVLLGEPWLSPATAQAPPPIEESGVDGGLAVWIGGNSTAADWAKSLLDLHADKRMLVLGLHSETEVVAKTRAELDGLDAYGTVSVDTLIQSTDGSLPMIDDSVNLLIVSSGPSIFSEDVLRVLAPLGVALIDERGQWTKISKPWPEDVDEWTHYMHDASNNAVAHDDRIGPPRHLQWQSGPRWGRHHDHMASVSAMVTARGRVFSILDEGARVSPQLPPDWKLVARNAFNGVLLWKLPIERWHDNLWPLKSGPANLPRRLVAGGDTVYATLGIDAPVTALNAATGKILREYADTSGAEEIVHKDRVLLVLVNRTPVDLDADLEADPEQGKSRDHRTTYSPTMGRIWAGVRSRRWTHGDRSILAFDAASGRRLWEQSGRVLPLTLAADAENVYYHDGDKVVALGLSDGQQRWASEPVPVWQGLHGQGLQSWFAPTLIALDGRVLFAGGEKIHMSYVGFGSKDIGQDTMTALSAETGQRLWTADHPYSGYNSPEDLFIAAGKVWTGVTAKGGPDGRYFGHDLDSGEMESDFPPTVDAYWFHHRCYRAKATDKYILSSRAGIEFIDLQTGQWTVNHWVRGGCLYGIMPANGLIYNPAHPCSCYAEAKLNGFTALAAARPSGVLPETIPAERRLERGPAFGDWPDSRSPVSEGRSEDWPTYRHDATRSGTTSTGISAKLAPEWNVRLGGRLTQPIVADGRVFIADVDRHAVHAVDADSGKRLWSFTCGGRIDSPPTYDRGRLVFGSANGYVYCLRAVDGVLAWRFRAAPIDRRLVAFDQVESVWPVHGSVLVQDGVVSTVAGRSMYLDGGLRLCRLDVETGRLLSEKILDDRDPNTGEDMLVHVKGLDMAVASPDILSSDGEHLYMRSQTMDLEGNRLELGPGSSQRDHLFAPYGFTDDSWFHRVYWLFGDGFRSGVGGYGNGLKKPGGRILVNNHTTVFGYGRKPEYYRWTSVIDYQLFAAARPDSDSGAAKGVVFQNSPSLDPTEKPLTISAWIKPDTADGTILVRGANLNGFGLIVTDGKPRMLLRTGGKTQQAVSERAIGPDWTHVAGVLRPDGRMEVYVDGQLSGETDSVPLLSAEPSIAMKVGYDDTNQLLPEPLVPYSGALDEVMLFHRALSPEEIQALAEGKTKFSEQDRQGQVLHLAFTGGKVRDRSAGRNHGQLAGGKSATVEGPFGEALVLVQPKKIIVPQQGKAKSAVAYGWVRDVPMMVRAMALAGDTLFIAGPADLLDENAAFQSFRDEATRKKLALQDAAWRGAEGAMLQAVNADTGQTLSEYELESPPVFDGLITAGGRVFIATMDGRLMAFGQPDGKK